MKVPVKWK